MKYFTISEMLHSDTAIANRIWNGANHTQEENLIELIEGVLDPLRERFGKPVYVTSGFRCAQLNSAVGGETNSQHKRGEAADIVASGGKEDTYELARIIASLNNFDQVILENVGKNDLLPEWVHVSYSQTCNRRQILKKVKGVAGYMVLSRKEIGL